MSASCLYRKVCYTLKMQESEKIKTISAWLGTGSINIFGRPFAGKDTQGRILAELLGGSLLGGGEILRASHMSDRIKAAMRTGKLIASEDYVELVLPYLGKDDFKDAPLILSSVGRWSGEEAGVIEATRASGHPLKAVIYLDLDDDIVRRRWAHEENKADRGVRHDDTKDILEIRLREFHDKTLPVIEHYRQLGLLLSIDADSTPEAINSAIIEGLLKISLV